MTHRREDLLERACLALVARPGASMHEISKRMGVGRATVYRYFPSREQLIDAIALDALARTNDATGAIPMHTMSATEALDAIIDTMIPFGAQYFFLAVEGSDLGDEVQNGVMAQQASMRELYAWAISTGTIHPDIDAEWLAIYFDGLIWSSWQAVSQGMDPDLVAAQAKRSFWAGVSVPGQKAEDRTTDKADVYC